MTNLVIGNAPLSKEDTTSDPLELQPDNESDGEYSLHQNSSLCNVGDVERLKHPKRQQMGLLEEVVQRGKHCVTYFQKNFVLEQKIIQR